MSFANKTLAAIEYAVVKRNEDEQRKHLGASVIGKECAREVWYGFRWARKGIFDGRTLRLFNRGHREEPNFVKLFRDAGATVFQAGEYGDKDELAAFRLTGSDGHFGGTPDGVIDNLPDQPTPEAGLLEFKTFNDNQFKKLKDDGVMSAKWVYFVQMQLYMAYHALPWALFSAVNKNDDELFLDYVLPNPKIAADYMAKADTIIHATEPPQRLSESAGFWKCKFCDFHAICHYSDAPEINCRTCAYSSVGPAGTWLCARGRTEVVGQQGCEEHNYDPRFFDRWTVVGGDFDKNLIEIETPQKKLHRLGPRYMPSAEFKSDCEVPF